MDEKVDDTLYTQTVGTGLASASVTVTSPLASKYSALLAGASELSKMNFLDPGSVIGSLGAVSTLIPGVGAIVGPALGIAGGLVSNIFSSSGPSQFQIFAENMATQFDSIRTGMSQISNQIESGFQSLSDQILNGFENLKNFTIQTEAGKTKLGEYVLMSIDKEAQRFQETTRQVQAKMLDQLSSIDQETSLRVSQILADLGQSTGVVIPEQTLRLAVAESLSYINTELAAYSEIQRIKAEMLEISGFNVDDLAFSLVNSFYGSFPGKRAIIKKRLGEGGI